MRIIYERPDGGIAIVHPANQNDVSVLPGFEHVADMKDGQYARFIAARDVPADAVNVKIVFDDEIPADRTFRDALKFDLTHDKTKAVVITRGRLRRERAPLLQALDVLHLRAIETGADPSQIILEKQRLRDITALVGPGLTLEEMKSIRAESALANTAPTAPSITK